MKLTCKDVKEILRPKYAKLVYKSGSNVRINLKSVSDPDFGHDLWKRIARVMEDHGICMYRDDPVHLPADFILEYK